MTIGLVHTAPSQWKKSEILGLPTPGERYLLPGNPRGLMRKDKPNDEELIVVEDELVASDRGLTAIKTGC